MFDWVPPVMSQLTRSEKASTTASMASQMPQPIKPAAPRMRAYVLMGSVMMPFPFSAWLRIDRGDCADGDIRGSGPGPHSGAGTRLREGLGFGPSLRYFLRCSGQEEAVMSEAKEWNLEPDGNVRLPEIRGWRTAGMGVGIGLQLRTGPRPDGLKEQPEYFQVALTSDQSRRLAQALLDAADKADGRLKGSA